MIRESKRFPQVEYPTEDDPIRLRHDLEEAHKTIRSLLRQIDKAQLHHDEMARAYNKTVANLMEVTRENILLEHECKDWQTRAEGKQARCEIGSHVGELTPAEVSAIRKAMARLHHPDRGGDAERMKAWNAALDPLEG